MTVLDDALLKAKYSLNKSSINGYDKVHAPTFAVMKVLRKEGFKYNVDCI